MVQEASMVTLGELFEETGESESDNLILERVKLLAQECLPEGWTTWKVTKQAKEDIFEERVDPQVLNKLRFALPTDQLARAFVPEATRLSEKGFRDLKLKMLDWNFTRALITGPPAICNKIRGSAAATEIFNEAVRPARPMSRKEADRALSLDKETDPGTSRRRRISSDPESCDAWTAKRSRLDSMEQRMNCMFSTIMEKISALESNKRNQDKSDSSEEEISSDEEDYPTAKRSSSPDAWLAPSMSADLNICDEGDLPELEFLPDVKEAEPAIPAPSEHIKAEGIACQRFGSEAWNRIRYKEVVKRLHAAPVFNSLKVNAELTDIGIQTSGFLSKQDGVLGTITHGLLCQRKALAEELKKLAVKFPAAAEDLRKLLSEGSSFKATSDDLLQYVCAHRAETIELRRRPFIARNEALSSLLHRIPPSPTHLFQEESLSSFARDNGGVSRIFPSRFGRFPEKRRSDKSFHKPKNNKDAVPLRTPKPKQSGQARSSQPTNRRNQPGHHGSSKKRGEKRDQRQQRRKF